MNQRNSLLMARLGFYRYSSKLMGSFFSDSLALLACLLFLLSGIFIPVNSYMMIMAATLALVTFINIFRYLHLYKELNEAFLRGGFNLDKFDPLHFDFDDEKK